ncbi:uncharacterized protein LOC112057364 [Bicyclus anynana]|uniref:Uncharacterized protein LOC112057364 n=1 Tax=Bicyclus anynana TaxID=110368 RepID=A0A6J1P783_BICAN|nr:uncharacterized protein LOC112057364 [Bicyclus anynana]
MDYNFVSKFTIKSNEQEEKLIYVKILWQNNKDHLFHIQVFSEEQSWSGDFSYVMCKNFREILDETEEQYINSVKDALRMNNKTYAYDFTHEGDSNHKKFYWKKKYEGSTGTMVHGFVSVKEDEVAGTKNDLIDFLITENKTHCNEIDKYQNKTENLNNELEKWKNELEKFVDMKNSLESSLYGKFVQLLNSKKRRIQELDEHLNNL